MEVLFYLLILASVLILVIGFIYTKACLLWFKKEWILLLLLLLFFKDSQAQNLVPNGDFEQLIACPISPGEIFKASGWLSTADFNNGASPDYLNACSDLTCGVPDNAFGRQEAHSGIAYAGLVVYDTVVASSREYLQIKLTSQLSANICYHFEMYLSLGEIFSRYSTNAIGAYFSDTLISHYNNFLPLPFIANINDGGVFPDTSTWSLFSGDYYATGTENYLLIGNFYNNLDTDTILINDDVIYMTSYVYADDVSLVEMDCNITANEDIRNNEIRLFPNPFNGSINVFSGDQEELVINLYDISGRSVIRKMFINNIYMNTDGLDTGIYMYEIRSNKGIVKYGNIVKE